MRHLSAVSYWFQKDMHTLPSSVAASPRRIARRIKEMEPASVCNAARQDYMKLHKAKMKWYVLLAIGPIKSGAAILWSQAGRTLLIMSGGPQPCFHAKSPHTNMSKNALTHHFHFQDGLVTGNSNTHFHSDRGSLSSFQAAALSYSPSPIQQVHTHDNVVAMLSLLPLKRGNPAR